jgi:hypothetical protein
MFARFLNRILSILPRAFEGDSAPHGMAGGGRLCHLVNYSQLVTKITVQGLKVVRQDYRRAAFGVHDNVAIVDVHDLRRFD